MTAKNVKNVTASIRQKLLNKSRTESAIKLTFKKGKIAIPNEVIAFTDAFAKGKQDRWPAFREKIKAIESPETFCDIINATVADQSAPIGLIAKVKVQVEGLPNRLFFLSRFCLPW